MIVSKIASAGMRLFGTNQFSTATYCTKWDQSPQDTFLPPYGPNQPKRSPIEKRKVMPRARRKNTLAICKTRSLFITVLLFPFPFQRRPTLGSSRASLCWRCRKAGGCCRELHRTHHQSTIPFPVHLPVESGILLQECSQEQSPDEYVWAKSYPAGRLAQGQSRTSH